MSIKGQDGIRINKDYAIGDAIAIAKHNGWPSIRVHGSDEFKKAVYLEGARSGVEVTGFKPSEQLKLEGVRDRKSAVTGERVSESEKFGVLRTIKKKQKKE